MLDTIPGPKPAKALQTARSGAIMPDKQRMFLMTVRQALIMLLGALEDYLEMDRSIVPKHERTA